MRKQLLSFLFASLISFLGYGQITIDESLTAQELIEDVLINSSCAEVSNIISSTGTDFGDVNGIAAFSANGSDFPFEEGIILMSGDVQTAPGPNTSTQSNGFWPGDADLEANTTAINTNNASFLEFNFTPFIEQISFNFIMASEEYDQNFECTFSDAFAFILTDITTGTVQNLAVLPGTTIPIEVTNIRPEVPGQCAAVNEEFFDRYNFLPFNDENAAATNFNGQTVQLTAMADVVSGNPYSIKLVVADQSDNAFDIGVFLEAGSFNIGTTDLGDDILVSNGNAACDGDTLTLNAEDPDAVSYTWFLDGVEITGETNSTLDVTTPGVYAVSVSLNNTDCTIEDEIVVEFITAEDVNLGEDIEACEGDAIVLDTGIPDTSATFSWFFNNVILIDQTNSTLNVTQSGEYAVVVNFNSGCSFSDVIAVNITTAPIIDLGDDTINSCLTDPITLDATPSNVDPSIVTFQWFFNNAILIDETSATLDATLEGTYNVVVTSGACVITDSVTIAPLTVLFELGDDFNTCFDETVTLDATPTNIDPDEATYVWTLNGTEIAGEVAPMLTITEEGTYEVTISLGICSNTDTITVTQANPDGSPCVEPEPSDCTLINAGPDVEVDCDNLCVDLNASILTLPLTSTSSYRIEQIECPNPPTEGDPTNLTMDDTWSDVIDLPFTFSYYQNDYTSLVIGANGQISFDTSLANQFNDWNIDPGQTIPNNDQATFPFNTIYGAFHDIDPGVNSAPDRINFFVSGDAPYRTFVLNFNMVPQFSCNDLLTTQQIILYESLNVVDVNIINKPVCDAWNDGLATLGIMGNDDTEFAAPEGRNTGNWEAFDESWRFIPDGVTSDDAVFAWTDEDGVVLSNDLIFNVCPTETTTYTATLTFTNPDGSTTTITDDVIVTSDTSNCESNCMIVDIDAGPDVEVDCEDPCVDLTASVVTLPFTSTSSYRIEQIECPNPPTDGEPTSLTTDDLWSDVIDLPFTFTYFQNDYTSLVIGANGQISFNTTLAGQANGWNSEPGELLPFNDEAAEPGAAEFPFNTIYGAFHDIDPSVNGDPNAINFFISGDAPFRTFVLNFDQVAQFSCNDLLTSQQIVLYETLNVIEVNIINKPVCAAWNDGLATLGIMGNDLTEFAVPDGRNTGDWEAFDESWRFIPNGELDEDVLFTWTDEDGAVISNDLTVNVCPTETTTYTATVTFTNPDGTTTTLSDDVTVTASVVDFTVDIGEDDVFCDINSFEIIPTLDGDVTDPTFLWSTGETTETIIVDTTGTYSVEVTVDGCVMMAEVTITFLESPCVIQPDCLVVDFIEDFGTGTDRVATPFSSYTFRATGQVDGGEYAIVNTNGLPDPMNGGWHGDEEDNTEGDIDGRAFYVNGDVVIDEFYRRPVTLQANTEYTFQAFLATTYDRGSNICPDGFGDPSNVIFRIEDMTGNLISELGTGDVQNSFTLDWIPFTFNFNTLENTDVQLVFINNTTGVCGNDFVIDDISISFDGGNPLIAVPADLELCDDLGDMVEIFDLTSQIPAILNGGDPADFNITFHTEQLDAEANVGAIATPNAYANTTNPETIYVRVERALDVSCFSVVDFDLILNEIFSLANNLPVTIEICSTDTIPELDATPIDTSLDVSSITYIWTDASNTTVSNDALFTPTTAGVYTVVVDLQPCSQETFTVELIIAEAPIVNLGPDELLCDDASFEIIPNITGDLTGATFLWSTGETTETIIVDQSGTYDLTVSVGPCTVTDSITITIADPVNVSLGDDFTTCREFPNTLVSASDDPNVTYQWLLNGDVITGETSSTLDFSIPESAVGTQVYTVVVTTAAGCTGEDSIDVSLFDVGNCVISQGISPDDTPGFNDTLDLEFLAARTGIDVIQIFNRLGTLVYEQNDYVNQWRGQTDNGTDLPTGTYFYVINLEGEDAVFGRQATGWIYINRGE